MTKILCIRQNTSIKRRATLNSGKRERSWLKQSATTSSEEVKDTEKTLITLLNMLLQIGLFQILAIMWGQAPTKCSGNTSLLRILYPCIRLTMFMKMPIRRGQSAWTITKVQQMSTLILKTMKWAIISFPEASARIKTTKRPSPASKIDFTKRKSTREPWLSIMQTRMVTVGKRHP